MKLYHSKSRAGRGLHIGVLGPMSLDLLPVELPPELQSLSGYPAPIISSIINGYLDRGVRVTAITTSVGLEHSVTVRAGRLTLAVLPRTGPRSALRMFAAERQCLLQVLEAEQPDVLHAHWSYEFAAAALDSGLPTLITVRDHAPTILKMALRENVSWSHRMQHGGYRFLRLLLNDGVLRRGQHFSVPSQYMFDVMPSRCAERTRVVPNFFNSELRDRMVPTDCRERRIVTVSNGFRGWKNVARAISAFAESRASGDGWEYELIGDQLGPGDPAAQWAEANGLTNGVRFTGRVPYSQALSAIASAAIMLHPSLEESFGMTVLEGMVLGTPVLGGAQSGNVPQLLRDDAGLLCDVKSVSSIAAGLHRLISNPDLRLEIAERASARAEQGYTRELAVDAYLQFLGDILERHELAERRPL